MKNYRLYLIRHGITQGNLEGKYIGTTDLPLCEEGESAISSLAALEVYPKVQKDLEWLKGGYDAAPPNGESFGHFTLRCLDGLEEIFKDMMANEVTSAAVITHSGVIMNLLSGYGLPKMKPIDFACNQGEGFEIQLSTFLWQHGPVFEIVGKLF